LPIIAVTAHALKGDRDKYVELGADGYVPKPIEQRELLEAMATLARPPVPGREAAGLYDRAALLEQAQGDSVLVRELGALLAIESVELMNRIETGFASGDYAEVQSAAHALKGAVGNFRAPEAVTAAAYVEGRARTKTLLPGDLERLARAVDSLTRALA
jgi:CheY-like chemotaxis protein